MIRLILLMCFLAFPAMALPLEEALPNAADEARAQSLFRELHCVVCQGQSIADSNADIATDMRREIRAQVASGISSDDIMEGFVMRYGESIRMTPPMNQQTALLWLAPLIILGGGLIIVITLFRRRV